MNPFKIFYVITFLLLMTFSSKAQTFFGDGQKYFFITSVTEARDVVNYSSYIDVIQVDSVVSDTEYYSVNSENNKYYLKQSNNQVFIKGSGYFNSNDSNYYLLYDFNLKEGDSLTGNLPNSLMKLVIDSVRNLQVGGKIRKVQFASGSNWPTMENQFIFIKGLGGSEFSYGLSNVRLSGGIEHYVGHFGEIGVDLGAICLNDTVLVWNYQGNPTCDFDYLTRLASVTELNKKLEIKIYPNPSNDKLQIDFQKETTFSYELTNSLGKVVKSGILQTRNSALIEVGSLQKGLYILKVKTGNSISTHKIIKE